jgi:hypothetical protein
MGLRARTTPVDNTPQRFGAGVIPSSTARTTRKYPTLFEGNVGVVRDADDPVRGGEGDLTIDGVLFCDTLAERREGNTINVVNETSFTTVNANMSERPTSGPPRQGQFLMVKGTAFTDTGDGERDRWSAVNISPIEIRSAAGPVGYDVSSTLEISGAPTGNADVTITDSRALTIKSGVVRLEDASDVALAVDGGITAGKTVRASDVVVFNQGPDNGKSIAIRPPAPIETSYSLTLPSAPPLTDDQIMSVGAQGQSQFVVPPISRVTSGTLQLTGTRLWVGTAVTTGGKATFYPTSDGSPDGTAFITTVLYAHATPVSETDVITASAFATRRSVSTDGRTIVFNVLTGAVVDAGGHTVQYAPDGVTVQALVVGL